MKRVFDAFTFYNELDLLEIRLFELGDEIDYFVICEATVTFRGQPKPLFFSENRERYKKYFDKIIHVVVDDMPTGENPWQREHFQRRALSRGLTNARPDDIVIISDADEFISRATARRLRAEDGYFQIVTPMFQFFFNTRASTKWNKVFAFSYKLHTNLPDFSLIRVRQNETLALFSEIGSRIELGGWHFTYLGGAERVRQKLSSYSHTGGVYDLMRQEGAIEEQLVTGYVVGGVTLTEIFEIDSTFPELIQIEQNRYRIQGYIKDTMVRVRELEKLFRDTTLKLAALQRQFDDGRSQADVLNNPPIPSLEDPSKNDA